MTTMPPIPAPAGFTLDPRWQTVGEETLRRPPIPLEAPGMAVHLVFRTNAWEAEAHRLHVAALIKALELLAELDRQDQIIASNPRLILKWERHTEFCSLSLLTRRGEVPASTEAFPPLPMEWRVETPGKLVVALKIAVQAEDARWVEPGFVAQSGTAHVKSAVNDGTGTLESSFRAAPDGFTHTLIEARVASPEQLGRMVQRAIEIETYRVLALYAWPDVQAIGPRLSEIDSGVARLTEQLGDENHNEANEMLDQLTGLARELENIAAQTHFRFNASIAYYDLVQRRLEDLRETRIEGEQRLSDLVNRRLNPAVRTYRSILTRQSEMSERVTRTSQLLRSRVDVELAQQNQALLASLDERGKQTYQLQLTVEGLSTVAISYYALGILSYALASVTGISHEIDTKLVLGIAAPFVVLLVWFLLRRWRNSNHGAKH